MDDQQQRQQAQRGTTDTHTRTTSAGLLCLMVGLSIIIGILLDRLLWPKPHPRPPWDTIQPGQQGQGHDVEKRLQQTSLEQQLDKGGSDFGPQSPGKNVDWKHGEEESPHVERPSQGHGPDKDRSRLTQGNYDQSKGTGIPDLKQSPGQTQDKEVSGLNKDNRQRDQHENPSLAVPYNGETVTAKQLDTDSVSLTGRPCGEDRCTHEDTGTMSSVCLTLDNRLLVVRWNTNTVHVHSATGVDKIQFTQHPFSVAQLPNKLVAITCPQEGLILLVDIDAEEDHVVRIIQPKKPYVVVASGFEPDTLIVASWKGDVTAATIDIIDLEGHVINTLADSNHVQGANYPISLTKTDHGVIVGALKYLETEMNSIMMEIRQSEPHDVQTYSDPLLSLPAAAAVDREGNVFITSFHGPVILKTKNGKYRKLLDKHDKQFSHSPAVVVHKNRLILAWEKRSDASTTTVVEYELYDPR